MSMYLMYLLRTNCGVQYPSGTGPLQPSPPPPACRLTYPFFTGTTPPINGCHKEYAGRRSPCSTVTKKAQWWSGGYHLRLLYGVQDSLPAFFSNPRHDVRFVVGVGIESGIKEGQTVDQRPGDISHHLRALSCSRGIFQRTGYWRRNR